MLVAKQTQHIKLLSKTILTGFLFFLLSGIPSSAQNPVDDLKQNISQKQQQLDEINGQILDLQKQINQAQKQAASLKNEIALFELQIRQTEKQISAAELEIGALSSQIAETQIAIKQKEEQIEKEKQFLAETLRLINEYDARSSLEITLGNDTFSQFLDQVQYATNLQEKTQEVLRDIKKLKQELERKKAELSTQLAQEQELKAKLDRIKFSLQDQKNQKQSLLAATRGQERIYQSLLTDAAQKQDQIEREIFNLELDVRKRLGDKSLPPISGLLRWPMSGILTQGYGKTGFTALGYNFHNGVDIAAPAGTTIYAAGDGVVYATGRGQAAYGNWVVIKHTIVKNVQSFNIYTLYGHMQQFAVSPGQAVKGGDPIGFEGNTGNTTRLLYGPERGYHVHFTVFDDDGFGIKDGAYQSIYGPYQIPYGYSYNPLDFLR